MFHRISDKLLLRNGCCCCSCFGRLVLLLVVVPRQGDGTWTVGRGRRTGVLVVLGRVFEEILAVALMLLLVLLASSVVEPLGNRPDGLTPLRSWRVRQRTQRAPRMGHQGREGFRQLQGCGMAKVMVSSCGVDRVRGLNPRRGIANPPS